MPPLQLAPAKGQAHGQPKPWKVPKLLPIAWNPPGAQPLAKNVPELQQPLGKVPELVSGGCTCSGCDRSRSGSPSHGPGGTTAWKLRPTMPAPPPQPSKP